MAREREENVYITISSVGADANTKRGDIYLKGGIYSISDDDPFVQTTVRLSRTHDEKPPPMSVTSIEREETSNDSSEPTHVVDG